MACDKKLDAHLVQQKYSHTDDHTGWSPIHRAVFDGNVSVLEELLAYRANMDAKMRGGYTPLHIAVRERKLDCFQLLSREGANVDITDDCGMRPLHHAAQSGEVHMLKKLLEFKYTINAQDKSKRTALHIALENKNLDCVEELLNAGIDVNARDSDGRIPLHMAVVRGYDGVVKRLLDLKADVNIQGRNKCTALHLALENKKFDCIEELLAAGAKVDIQDSSGRTSLHLAIKLDYGYILKKLLIPKANVNIQDRNHHTPLHIAIEYRKLDSVEALLKAGADVSIQDRRGLTPLYIATSCGDYRIWKRLLETKPKVLSDNSALFKIFETVIRYNNLDYFDDLVEAGASLHANDGEKTTLLHVIAQLRYRGKYILKKLLAAKLDVNVQDRWGYTPLHVACRYLDLEHVALLLEAGARWDITDDHKQTMMWDLIDSLVKYSYWPKEITLLKRILKRTNDGTVIDYTNGKTAGHCVLERPIRRTNDFELVKLVISTQKDLNRKDYHGRTVLNYFTPQLRLCGEWAAISFIRLCVTRGAYLTHLDCSAISNHTSIRENLLQDENFCMKSIINEFNGVMLPQFYEILNSNNIPWIVPIEALRINPGCVVWRMIEEDVRSEIEKNGYCDVGCMTSTSLSKQCVESYCNYFNS